MLSLWKRKECARVTAVVGTKYGFHSSTANSIYFNSFVSYQLTGGFCEPYNMFVAPSVHALLRESHLNLGHNSIFQRQPCGQYCSEQKVWPGQLAIPKEKIYALTSAKFLSSKSVHFSTHRGRRLCLILRSIPHSILNSIFCKFRKKLCLLMWVDRLLRMRITNGPMQYYYFFT